ncbi:MAG: hypothetical protein ACYDBQ_04950 [Thermoplasmatota archaeon]
MARPWILLVLLVAAAQAAAPAFLSVVVESDSDIAEPLQPQPALVMWYDANGNQKLDLSSPAEPVYLEIANGQSVTYGDIRLTPFANYPAQSVVDLADRDVGRPLSGASWVGSDGGTWYADVDGNHAVSAGDIRMGSTLEMVAPGDSAIGHGLSMADTGGLPRGQVWAPANRGVAGPLYVDPAPYGPGARSVGPGFLRIQATGFFAEAAPAPVTVTVTKLPVATSPPTTAATVVTVAPSPGGFSAMELLLALVGIVNLVGLVIVARRLPKAPPRNPFQ